MKKTIILTAIAALMCCLPVNGAGPKRIAPMPPGVDIRNLRDCTVPASFTTEGFRWMGGNLRMTVFCRDLYGVADVSRMEKGDTIIYASKPVVIDRIEVQDGSIRINGGLDEGGLCLSRNKGGNFVARMWDDHATYTELGETEEALDCGFIIIDCGIDPRDPVDTIRTGQKPYIEDLEGSRREFNQYNTTVTLKDGMITEICRRWIP